MKIRIEIEVPTIRKDFGDWIERILWCADQLIKVTKIEEIKENEQINGINSKNSKNITKQNP